jgi:lipoyl(octanoyl) transferase
VTTRIRVFRPGLVRYDDAHALQVRLQAARIRGLVPDTLLLLEHPPVITLGRGAKEEHLRFPRENLRARGVDVHEVGRGGDVTYHGPGQMVAYPILALPPGRQDVRRYVKELEEAMILLASDYGLSAERIQGFNGTWLRSSELGDRKIGAIGVRISRWVTMHGLAFNVSTNLAHFGLIVPCGIEGKGVTSLAMELDREVAMHEVMDRFEARFASLFDATLERGEGDPLEGLSDAELELATLSA